MSISAFVSPYRALVGLGMFIGLYGSLAPGLNAQQYELTFEHLTIADGLSQQDVHVIRQDALGFLWFGTEDGLNRYDGQALRVYRPVPFDTTSLAGTWIVGLALDDDGSLWVATETKGLNHYDPRTETFRHIAHEDGDDQTPYGHNLWSLLRARDGHLWLGARGDGLTRFHPASGSVARYDHTPDDPRGLTGLQINALIEDEAGRIWIGTGTHGLNRYNLLTGTFTHYRHDPSDLASLPHDEVKALLFDREGTLWVGTGAGLARYDAATDRFVTMRPRPGEAHNLGGTVVTALLEDPNGILWVGTDHGLVRFDRAVNSFTAYQHDPTDPTSLGPGSIHTLYLDRSGVFWVGMQSGLSRFAWDAPRFPLVRHDPNDANTLSDPGVWSFLQDQQGTLWVGTEVGLDRFNPATGAVTHYRHNRNDPTSLTPGWVVSLLEDAEGHMWVGTRRDGVNPGGLNRFDPATGTVVEQFITNPEDPTSLKSDNPWFLFEDSQRQFWVLSGGTGCHNLMDRDTGTFTPFCPDPDDPNTASYAAAKGVVEQPPGVLWFANWGGGFDRYDTRTGVWTNYRHDPNNRNSPTNDYLLTIYKDREGIIWLGSYGAGLNRFDPVTETFTHFTEATSGLPNDVVYAIQGDADGYLWISTNKGLTRFDTNGLLEEGADAMGRQHRFRTFGLENGLQDLEFNAVSAYRARSGELFFGGIKGFNRFFPDQVGNLGTPPPVVLTDLRIRSQTAGLGKASPLDQAVPYTETLQLRHDQHDIAFTFAALHYADPTRNSYRYRLEGYDEAWFEPGPERTATYTNLAPSSYTFRVQAASKDAVWNETGTSLAFTIAPPPWRTGWAYTGYALLAGALLFGLWHYQKSRLQLQSNLEREHIEAEQLRTLDRSKSRFFANVSHEFRTPLTLTIGPLDDVLDGFYGDIPEEAQAQVTLARRNAERVLDLINEMLDIAKLEAGRLALRAYEQDLGAFIAYVAQAFVPLAERKGITFQIPLPPDPVRVFFDAAQLEKVLANLLANAFKFTPVDGTIRLSMQVEAPSGVSKSVRVMVRDTGPGIPASQLQHVFDRFHQVDESAERRQAGTGIGLALVRELVHLHGGQVAIESAEGFGSTFIVTLPLGKDHLDPEQITETPPLWSARPRAAAQRRVASLIPLPKAEASVDSNNGEADPDRPTVLVVDDNADVRAYIRRHLQNTYHVAEAADGAEGVAQANTLLPDLVISDVMMPEMSGFSLCQALKTNPETDFIPVILLTARAEAEDKLKGFGVQADDYMTKPFNIHELAARVDNLIASRKLLRERFQQNGLAPVLESNKAMAPLQPTEPDVTPADIAYLEQVQAVIETHLDDETFSVEQLAAEVGQSRSQLHRRLRDLLGLTPTDVIRTMRLLRAAQLLEARVGSISEIAYAVGFKSVAHFSNSFNQHFGCRPSAYMTAG